MTLMRCNRCHRAMRGTTAYDGACECGGLIEAPPVIDGPEPCYTADVDTLREVLKEEQERLADAEQGITDGRALAGYIWNKARATRRIEAIRTAIEALGGCI